MDKLEPKDITGNLPYKLKCLVGGEPDKDSEIITGLSFDYHGWWVHFEDEDCTLLDSIMPILRPMGDLTKETEIDGERFVPAFRMAEYEYSVEDAKYSIDISGDPEDDSVYIKVEHDSFEDEPVRYYRIPTRIDAFQLWELDLLNQWHFDYRGLIGKRLAVDINTLG